jgi:hypothetical protein
MSSVTTVITPSANVAHRVCVHLSGGILHHDRHHHLYFCAGAHKRDRLLRSIGASKRDIYRVFNAETLTIGLYLRRPGHPVTLLLCIPANALIKNLTGISNVALLPAAGAVILVLISMLLTFIAA